MCQIIWNEKSWPAPCNLLYLDQEKAKDYLPKEDRFYFYCNKSITACYRDCFGQVSVILTTIIIIGNRVFRAEYAGSRNLFWKEINYPSSIPKIADVWKVDDKEVARDDFLIELAIRRNSEVWLCQ